MCDTVGRWSLLLGTPDKLLLEIVNKLILLMATNRLTSHMAIDLIRMVSRRISPTQLSNHGLQGLLQRCRQEVVQLVIESKEDIYLPYGSIARKLQFDQLLMLVERYPDAISKYDFMRLTPNQRTAIYQLMGQVWRSDEGVLPLDTISALPTKERQAEARRYLKLPSFTLRPLDQIAYAHFLPWDEGMVIQRPFLRSSEADVRSLALQKQIKATIYQEEHISDALQLVL